MTSLTQVSIGDFDGFLAYLDDHLADNGRDGTGYFQPLSRDDSRFPADKAQAFRTGLGIEVSAPGWRRLWVARRPALSDGVRFRTMVPSHRAWPTDRR